MYKRFQQGRELCGCDKSDAGWNLHRFWGHAVKICVSDILPAHLGIEYNFWYLTRQELEDNFPSWQAIEDLDLSWTQLETFVEFL